MISKLVAYETGQLDDDEVVALFQQLLDTGVLYLLQGHYLRTAQCFLKEGLITKSPSKKARRRAAKRGPKALAAAAARAEEWAAADARVSSAKVAWAAAEREYAAAKAEEALHAECMEDAFGPHGQG